MRNALAPIALVVCLLLVSAPAALLLADQHEDTAILEIIRERVDTHRKAVGMVVGVVDRQGSRIISHGTLSRDSDSKVNGDTVFEIASNTKLFTSLLLAEMAGRGELKLDDPISKILPEGVGLPGSPQRAITLLSLATHTSGLPRWPDNMQSPASYTVQDLYAFLAGYELGSEIGTQFQYSNVGVGLLGHILALSAGKSYEPLLIERITTPLQMSSTKISLTAGERERLATGYAAAGAPAPAIAIKTLEGGGALRSTANDLVIFLEANLGLRESKLAPYLEAMHTVRFPTNDPERGIGLAWFVLERPHTSISYHTGGSAGYRSFIGLDLGQCKGVVVLSNLDYAPDDIGFHILDSSLPLAKIGRKKIAVDAKLFDAYVGEYQLSPASVVTISKIEDTLVIQMTGTRQAPLAAESETEYFLEVVDLQVRFIRDQDGRVDILELTLNGRVQTAHRISD
jgi:CubicO group peptidase (beta-lactamase class C family)